MEIKTTIPALDMLELQPSQKTLKKMIRALLGLLKKYFGSKILLEVPEHLQDINPSLYQALETAARIKSLGIFRGIQKIPRQPDEPFQYFYSSMQMGGHGTGTDFFSEQKTIWKVLGESVERHLWFNSNSFYKNLILQSSFKALRDRALNIFSLAGFSNGQKQNFRCLKFDESTRFSWMPANSLTEGRKIYCPVQLLSARYFREKVRTLRDENKEEPMLRWSVTTGLAAGRSIEEAIVKGFLEVVERDAFMITYLNKLSPPKIDLKNLGEQDHDLAKVIKSFERYNLEVNLLDLPTDFPVNIFLAVLVDHTGIGPSLTVGANADFKKKNAILAALSEALIVRTSIKKSMGKQIDLNNIGRQERMIYWTRKENLHKMEFLFRGQRKTIDLEKSLYEAKDENQDESHRNYFRGKKDILSSELRKKKYKGCYAELATSDIKNLGIRVATVVIPQLHPLHLHESIPYLGSKRLREVPLKLGYEPAEELNREPHPFP